MCKSKCSGTCVSLLKVNLINSDEALKELIDLFNNITVCASPKDTDKKLFMTEVINLKAEARKLLNEVNHSGIRSTTGKQNSTDNFFENIFEDNSFKERLNTLKQRIYALSAQELIIK